MTIESLTSDINYICFFTKYVITKFYLFYQTADKNAEERKTEKLVKRIILNIRCINIKFKLSKRACYFDFLFWDLSLK